MVLCTKNMLTVEVLLITLSSSGISNYIKIQKITFWKNSKIRTRLTKAENDKVFINKMFRSNVLIKPCFLYKNL